MVEVSRWCAVSLALGRYGSGQIKECLILSACLCPGKSANVTIPWTPGKALRQLCPAININLQMFMLHENNPIKVSRNLSVLRRSSNCSQFGWHLLCLAFHPLSRRETLQIPGGRRSPLKAAQSWSAATVETSHNYQLGLAVECTTQLGNLDIDNRNRVGG